MMTMEVQEDIVDVLLRYGLFIGAIFQLVCIGAVIIMPDSKSDGLNVSHHYVYSYLVLT